MSSVKLNPNPEPRSLKVFSYILISYPKKSGAKMLINTHNKNTKPTTIKKLVLREAMLAPWKTEYKKNTPKGAGKTRVKNLPISKGFFALP